jgi:hypothetical protein
MKVCTHNETQIAPPLPPDCKSGGPAVFGLYVCAAITTVAVQEWHNSGRREGAESSLIGQVGQKGL